ncbi:MAG: hypothetical protein Q9174_004205 [Haloplaca sp. 1 TL-2023]
MEPVASTITIVKLAWSLAQRIQKLIEGIRQQDENAKLFVDKFNALTAMLQQTVDLYGQDENNSPREQQIKQKIRTIAVDCKDDLEKFEPKLKRLAKHGDWASVAWKQNVAYPAFDSMEKSVWDRHQILHVQVQSLHTLKLEEIHRILTPADPVSPSTAVGEEVQVERPGRAESGSSINEEGVTMEADAKGKLLLESIGDGDYNAFQSLLSDSATSLTERDAQGRTPLLLAAYLDKLDMVKQLLFNCADVDQSGCSSTVTSAAPPADHPFRRAIDFSVTDRLGRSALHYCAEFGMCDEACLVLNHGADINAQDNSNYPPAYYAIKNRKYHATKLLLSKGAIMDFPIPAPTSHEIEELLETASGGTDTTTSPDG